MIPRSILAFCLCLGLLSAQAPPAPVAQSEPVTPDLPAIKPLEVPPRVGISGEANIELPDVVRLFPARP